MLRLGRGLEVTKIRQIETETDSGLELRTHIAFCYSRPRMNEAPIDGMGQIRQWD